MEVGGVGRGRKQGSWAPTYHNPEPKKHTGCAPENSPEMSVVIAGRRTQDCRMTLL